jgi:hypothetical protein
MSAVSVCESKEKLGDVSLAVRHNFSLVVRHTQVFGVYSREFVEG